MIHNITLFVVVMLLTVLFLRQATADEQRQDPDNTCYLTDTCKPTGSVDTPFN